jgi:hypothetical protein
MIDPLFFFLPMILFLGGITTYEDYRQGKIRNKWILIALVYAVAMNILVALYIEYLVPEQFPRAGYYIELIVQFVASLLVGFVMWWIGLWTAGDAKLFAAFSALVPLSVYNWGHVPYFSSSNILINTFVPFFIFYSCLMLYKTTWKQKAHYLLQSLQPRQVLMLFLFIFGFSWPLRHVFSSLAGNYFTGIALLFILLVLLERIFGRRLFTIMVVVSAMRIIFDRSLMQVSAWIYLGITLLGFIILRFFILYMGYDFLTKRVDVNLVKPGMVPAETVYVEDGKYRKKKILHFAMVSYLQEATRKRDYLFEPTPEGLTENDVRKLHKMQGKLGFEHLRVYKTLSFAPFLFVGVLLTIFFKGQMFISIASYLTGLNP